MDKRRVKDQLVELAVGDEDLCQLVQVAFVADDGLDVGRLAARMLAVGAAAHEAVEFGAAVAAADADGLAVGLPEGVENLVDQGPEALFRLLGGTIPELVFGGGVALQKLADGEVLHLISNFRFQISAALRHCERSVAI